MTRTATSIWSLRLIQDRDNELQWMNTDYCQSWDVTLNYSLVQCSSQLFGFGALSFKHIFARTYMAELNAWFCSLKETAMSIWCSGGSHLSYIEIHISAIPYIWYMLTKYSWAKLKSLSTWVKRGNGKDRYRPPPESALRGVCWVVPSRV